MRSLGHVLPIVVVALLLAVPAHASTERPASVESPVIVGVVDRGTDDPVVPEPVELVLLGIGLLAVGHRLRGRKPTDLKAG